MFVYVSACESLCVYKCTFVCVRVYACVCVYVSACESLCVYKCTFVCVRVYACVCGPNVDIRSLSFLLSAIFLNSSSLNWIQSSEVQMVSLASLPEAPYREHLVLPLLPLESWVCVHFCCNLSHEDRGGIFSTSRIMLVCSKVSWFRALQILNFQVRDVPPEF